MGFPYISHHGAIQGVTGSCHQLHLNESSSLLVDCGSFLGSEAALSEADDFQFSVQGIRALIVTHVHLDHVGRIPQLFASGFNGPIICSEPSAKLLPLVLEDAFKLGVSRAPSDVARYLRRLEEKIQPLPFGQWHELFGGPEGSCRIRLQRAGHVLGSAYVECDVLRCNDDSPVRVVFSGDIGSGRSPLLVPPLSPERADILVLESTYGDRLHDSRSTRAYRLEQAIDRALEDHGTILIPAFSVGRTQELLYEIEDILYRKSLVLEGGGGSPAGTDVLIDWPQLPVILDSPLAIRLTAAYRQLSTYWNEEARRRLDEGRHPLGFRQLIEVVSPDSHQKVVNYLASTGRPAIVIAGNGMCSGGRIVRYLKSMLRDPRHEVVFTGYQAKGTPGAVIQASEGSEGFVMVDLDSEMHEVRSRVTTLGGYSAHADQAGLLDFVKGMRVPPVSIVLVHGEQNAKEVLAEALRACCPNSIVEVAGAVTSQASGWRGNFPGAIGPIYPGG